MATIGLARLCLQTRQPYDNITFEPLNEAKLSLKYNTLYLIMSYNPRMSMVPNSQQQNRGKKKEEDSDAFMRLVRIHPPPPYLRRTY
jgi:hypothetical protein